MCVYNISLHIQIERKVYKPLACKKNVAGANIIYKHKSMGEYNMTLKDIAVLSCKILSITAFIKFVSFSHGIVYSVTQQEFEFSKIMLIQIFSLPAVFLAISIILWCFAKNISTLMVNDSASFDEVINFDYNIFKPIIFSIIGIILLTQAVPSLANKLVNIIDDIKRNTGLPYKITTFNLGYLIEYFLKLIIALYLIIGPKKVKNFIKSTRSIGVTKENDNDIKGKIIEK